MNNLLTINDLCNLLHISRSKAYSLSNSKDFPIIKIGKNKRVFEEDLIQWLKNHKKMI
jgi:excisionase family DNA binding protein